MTSPTPPAPPAPPAKPPATLTPHERMTTALELRCGGAPYWQIGKQLGATPEEAQALVDQAIAALHEPVAETSAQARAIELARLDGMLVALNLRKDANTPAALDTKLRLLTRRARVASQQNPVLTDPRYEDPFATLPIAALHEPVAETSAQARAIETPEPSREVAPQAAEPAADSPTGSTTSESPSPST